MDVRLNFFRMIHYFVIDSFTINGIKTWSGEPIEGASLKTLIKDPYILLAAGK